MSLPGIQTQCLNCVAFDPEGRYLMAAGGAMVRDHRRSRTLREVIAWNLPDFDLRWHVIEEAKARIAGLTIVPGGQEFITRSCETLVTVWKSEDPRPVRTIPVEFLCGNVVCLPDGSQIVAPSGNVLEFRQLSDGDIARRIALDSDRYTAAKTAACLPGSERLAVGCQVIHNNGSVSGLLVLVDLATERVIHKTVVDVEPTGIASDPLGRWLCVVGKRKSRGYVLFWDLATWKKLAGGGAHGRAIDDVCVCPDGTLVATCGADNIIRLWSTANWKTIAKFDEHACEGTGTSGLAWSADGSCLAYANSSGAPPRGGVFVYQRGSSDRQWQLVSAHRGQTSADSGHTRRHLQILGSAAEWIAAQVEKLQSIKQDAAQAAGAATPVPSASVDRAEWLTQFLIENASPEPLANSARVQAWSRTHGIQLPQDYQRFATTVGNKRFRNLVGLEGLDVNIVGPDRLDCESFRRDPPENPEDDPEPDGLLFAIAVNGDCLCFDLRGPAPDYPVVYFDHETETFSPYANTFAAAVHRLASGE